MAKKKDGLNKKLLNQMSVEAMPKPKPTMRLYGKDAKRMHGRMPGSNVKMTVHGKVMQIGMETYGDKGPMAEVEVHKIQMQGKGKKKPADSED